MTGEDSSHGRTRGQIGVDLWVPLGLLAVLLLGIIISAEVVALV